MAHISLEQARSAKRATQQRLEASGQDAAVGLTRVDGEYAVKVNVAQAPPTARRLPSSIEGVAVKVEVVGPIKPRGRAAARRP
ncbi:hypothetical protein TBR22_A44570 [Luteitalea sp. TBR-22]|uniref:hypothetical protein n=1 Tax=Luteitalea sp. TBR-22 TaxID=2802971 RepID=UPI001AFB195E|nr:hypothetical protein [Luteitalea sp. TBR-22]BCS35230.1 hypothetical protein TBR22_A44570 [Luteitalea sp. TBR-22]